MNTIHDIHESGKWELQKIESLALSQLLFVIEYATLDAQDAIGMGLTGLHIIDQPGGTSSLGNASGHATEYADGSAAVSYRGEEGLWGGYPKLLADVTINGDYLNITTKEINPAMQLMAWTNILEGYLTSFVLSPYFLPATLKPNRLGGIVCGDKSTRSNSLEESAIAYGSGMTTDAGLFAYKQISPGEVIMRGFDDGDAAPICAVRMQFTPPANTESDTPDASRIAYSPDAIADSVPYNAATSVEQALRALHDKIERLDPSTTFMINTWEDVQTIVRAGKAQQFFKIGDCFMCNHTEYGQLAWRIIGFNADTPADGERSYSMTLMCCTEVGGMNISFDAPETGNPDTERASNGSNDWEASNLRQWLNSNGTAGSWWTAQSTYDAAPTYAASLDGFLKGLDTDFLAVLGAVYKTTAVHTYGADGGVTSTTDTTTEDTMFLPSITEVYGGDNNGVDEGSVYELFQNNSDNAAPSTSFDQGRNIAGGYDYWLRSASVAGSYVVWYVIGMNGHLRTSRARWELVSGGVAPACVIV